MRGRIKEEVKKINPGVQRQSSSLFFFLSDSALMSSFHSPLVLSSAPLFFFSLSQEKLTFGPRNSYTVEGLKANTEYSFSLAAISSKGIGAFTNELVQRTSQASTSPFHWVHTHTHTHTHTLRRHLC